MGLGGNLGRGLRPLMRVFLFLLPKSELSASVTVEGDAVEFASSPPDIFSADAIVRPAEPPLPGDIDPQCTVPLIRLAWARSGDKGDLFNAGVFAREAGFYPYIAAALGADDIAQWFAHLLGDPENPNVERFVLPGSHGLNFIVHNSLGGGGSLCARIDPLAKTMAQILLDFPIPISRKIADRV